MKPTYKITESPLLSDVDFPWVYTEEELIYWFHIEFSSPPLSAKECVDLLEHFDYVVEVENEVDYKMEKRENIQMYRDFEVSLMNVRENNKGEDSEEEDTVLDFMMDYWCTLLDDERDYLNRIDGPNHEALIRWLN